MLHYLTTGIRKNPQLTNYEATGRQTFNKGCFLALINDTVKPLFLAALNFGI